MTDRGQYLVTGGAGFLGSHLVDRLLAEGHHVTVVDDGSGGGWQNLDPHQGEPRLKVHAVAVEAAARGRLLRGLVQRCNAILHLAAVVGPLRVLRGARACIERNHAAAAAILAAAADAGRPILMASSSEVYGRSRVLPFREDADLLLGPPHHPRWAYATGKALIESLALAHAREQQLPVVVARIFNTVGPRQSDRYGLVLPTFVRQALRGEPITVHGDGRQTRCFAHVQDTVAALLALLRNPAAIGQIVNVGTDEETMIAALAEQVCATVRSRSAIVLVPAPEAEAQGYAELPRRRPDLGRLVALAGFRPQIPLHRILADVVADLRARIQAGASTERTLAR